MTLMSTQITNMIATVGFPICSFFLMWNFATKTMKENTKALENLTICVNAKVL
jgi:hypothetical protein